MMKRYETKPASNVKAAGRICPRCNLGQIVNYVWRSPHRISAYQSCSIAGCPYDVRRNLPNQALAA